MARTVGINLGTTKSPKPPSKAEQPAEVTAPVRPPEPLVTGRAPVTSPTRRWWA
nr:hypothetical protein [Rhodococcus wratislaviensis]